MKMKITILHYHIIWTSSDESLMIASNYYEETNLLKFTITYDNGNKTLSVIKQIF